MARRQQQLEAEARLLNSGLEWWRTISRDHQLSWTVRDVSIHDVDGMHRTKAGTEALQIHTIEYHCAGKTPAPAVPALVCLHGFGFGAALYYAALPALAAEWNGAVFAVDTLGCGLSSRPRWPFAMGSSCDPTQAEQYFVDALEAWRQNVGLETMVLIGHSVGGYLAVAYAERHPERCARLVLASPVGVPEPPASLKPWQDSRPLVLRIVFALWRRGHSPFTLAKQLGQGRKMMTGYVTRRFADGQGWIPKPELIEYLVRCVWCGGPHSAGGRVHSTLLAPGGVPPDTQGELAYARKPIGGRILAPSMPNVACIYGEYDWMNWRNAKDVAVAAAAARPLALVRVAQATHQLMIDNPRGFADAVLATARGEDPGVLGAGFGGRYGAAACVWKRREPLPQDNDPIEVWVDGHEPEVQMQYVRPTVP